MAILMSVSYQDKNVKLLNIVQSSYFKVEPFSVFKANDVAH